MTYETVSDRGPIRIGTSDERPRRIFESVQARFVGTPPRLLTASPRPLSGLAVAQYSDNWAANPKTDVFPLLDTNIVYGCVDTELAPLWVGQLGQLQECRQALTTRARSVTNQLLSLDMFVWPWLGNNNRRTITDTDEIPSTDSGLQTFCSHSLYVPYEPSTYYQIVQDELLTYVVGVFVDARAYLEKALNTFRDRLRFVGILIATLRTVASFANIFCSVRWEKRRWFLFHGARPPKSTAQAMWSCLPEACSGSALA